MMNRITSLLLAIAPAFSCLAEEPDVLDLLLAKSDLVVSCTIDSRPAFRLHEIGTMEYTFTATVDEALWGLSPEVRELEVSLTRNEWSQEDRLPYLKEGTRCILFLCTPGTHGRAWRGVDRWFSVQPHNGYLARKITEMWKHRHKRTPAQQEAAADSLRERAEP